jgi:hypothetical protein
VSVKETGEAECRVQKSLKFYAVYRGQVGLDLHFGLLLSPIADEALVVDILAQLLVHKAIENARAIARICRWRKKRACRS